MNKKNVLKPETWEEHAEAGAAYGAGSDWARAESSFREALRLAPDESYPHYGLGLTLFLAGRYGEALPELRRTNESARGIFLIQQELYMCEQIVSGHLSQEGLQLLQELEGLTDSGDAQSAQAQQLARQAIDAAPQCAIAYVYLGKALLNSDPAGAETALRRCLELEPDDTTAMDAKIHLGMVRQQAGATDEALSLLRGVIADYNDCPYTRICKALLGQDDGGTLNRAIEAYMLQKYGLEGTVRDYSDRDDERLDCGATDPGSGQGDAEVPAN
jgi:tetratricopeptide (TPR) repeat protein